MNGQLNSSLATENAAFAKIKALSKKVDNLEQDTIANKEEIDALDNELYELSSKQNYNIDTLTANSIDVTSSAVVNSLTCKNTVTSENVEVNNTLNANKANITNLSSVTSVDAVNVNADSVTANSITCVEEFVSNKNEIVEENISKTLNVNGTSNLTGQVNVAGNMTFTKDSGNSVLAGQYLEVQADKVVPNNLFFDPEKTGPEELPAITGRVSIDGVVFENTTPQFSVTDFAASDANITDETVDNSIVKKMTILEQLNLGDEVEFTGNLDASNVVFKGVKHSGQEASTALGIDGNGQLVINNIPAGGLAETAKTVENTTYYTTNFYKGGMPSIQLDTEFAKLALPTYITMLKKWLQTEDSRYRADFFRWHELDLDNEGITLSSIDSDQQYEYARKWAVLRQLLINKDEISLLCKKDNLETSETEYENKITASPDSVSLSSNQASITIDPYNNIISKVNNGNGSITVTENVYGIEQAVTDDVGNITSLYIRPNSVETTLNNNTLQNQLIMSAENDSIKISTTSNLEIEAKSVKVNGKHQIHDVLFDKIITEDNYQNYLATVTDDEETIYIDMTTNFWLSGYVVLRNKTIYGKEWWLLEKEYPYNEYLPENASLQSKIYNVCLNSCTVIGCKVVFTVSPSETTKYCLDKDDKFINCYVYKENWTEGLVDTAAGVGQLIETPEDFCPFEHSHLKLSFTSSLTMPNIGFLNSKNSQFNLDMSITTLTFTKDGNNVYKCNNTHPNVVNKLNTLPTGYTRQDG